MKVAVIIPAAGAGTRFRDAAGPAGSGPMDKSKIETDLAGQPVFLRAVDLFTRRREVERIVLAVPPQRLDDFKLAWGDKLGFHGVSLVAGGETERWQTVLNALGALERLRGADGGAASVVGGDSTDELNPDSQSAAGDDAPAGGDVTHIAVHDAARPLTSTKLIDRVFEAAQRYDAVIPGLAVSSTLKHVEETDGGEDTDPMDAILGDAGKNRLRVQRVVETVDRTGLVEVQTPQVFAAPLLRRAYARVAEGTIDPARLTDDAALIEALGEPVHVVDGESTNLKITRPEDMELATAIAEKRRQSEAAGLAKKRLFGDDED